MKLIAVLITLQVFQACSSFTINCNFQSFNFSSAGNLYICSTSNLPLTSGTTVTAITGVHESEKTNSDVEAIDIQGNFLLPFFPGGFSDFFPYIKAISVHYTTISTLQGDELEEFSQLQFFVFGQSNLTTISSRLFEKTPNLVLIWFDWNTIEKVGYDLFTPLNVSLLRDVSFFSNRCISRWATTQSGILALINELREKCPFDDEEFSTTTALVSTTQETTTETSICTENIEELVCKLKDEVFDVQEKLTNLEVDLNQTNENLNISNERSNEIQNELNQLRTEMNEKLQLKDEKIEELKIELERNAEEFRRTNMLFQERMLRFELELLRISNNCGCN